MATIVTRAGKGSALTHNEVDANFNNLNNDKYEAGDSATLGASSISANTTTDALRITQTGTGNAFVVEDSTSPDATPFVIDAAGRVLIGQATFSTSYTLEIASANPISTVRYANNVNPPTNLIGKSRSTTPGVFSTVLSGDNLGILAFAGDDGTAFTQAASISSAVDGTPGTGSMPGRLTFLTTPSGSATPVERMRITSDGEVYIAGSTDRGAFNLQCNGTGVWGAGAYTNGSDARIKEEIEPLASSLEVVKKLNPVTFKYKEDWSSDRATQTGFIAQELQEALANEVYINGVVNDTSEYMSVAYQNIIPILTKAIQELNAKVEALEAHLNKE
jgi:hypothetical protein